MKVLNIKDVGRPEGAINIMRPSLLGDPFVIGKDGSRDEVVDKHMRYARWRIGRDEAFKAQVRRLKGFDLLCCCAPARCHGDNLVVLCQELNRQD